KRSPANAEASGGPAPLVTIAPETRPIVSATAASSAAPPDVSGAASVSPSATAAARDVPVGPKAPSSKPRASSSAASPRKAASCDPPYTLDDQGKMHWRPECR